MATRVELRRACTGDDLVGMPAQCCAPETIRTGEVVIVRPHPVYPVYMHLVCVERAMERAERDLVEYPTVRAARLDLQGKLPAHRSGVQLRDARRSA